jgi:hypothetical protein
MGPLCWPAPLQLIIVLSQIFFLIISNRLDFVSSDRSEAKVILSASSALESRIWYNSSDWELIAMQNLLRVIVERVRLGLIVEEIRMRWRINVTVIRDDRGPRRKFLRAFQT